MTVQYLREQKHLGTVQEIRISPKFMTVITEYGAAHNRWIYLNRSTHIDKDAFDPAVNGDSIGHWEGDTLVVETNGFNDSTWFDRSGNYHSGALKVTERFKPIDDTHLSYSATIDDPEVFTRPWTISMPLYRDIDPKAEVLEFKCVPFTEQLLYGDLYKQPKK